MHEHHRLARLTALALPLIAIAAVPSSSFAPQEARHVARVQEPAARPEKLVLEPGTYTVKDLIDRSARFLGRNYIYSARDVENVPSPQVNLQERLELGRDDCEEVIGKLLFAKHLVMLPLDPDRGIYEWVFLQGSKGAEVRRRPVVRTPEQVLAGGPETWIVTVYPLEHLDPREAGGMLRAIMSGPTDSFYATTSPLGRSLVISGFRQQVAAFLRILQATDRPDARTTGQAFARWKSSLEDRLKALEQQVAALRKASSGR